MSSAGWVAKNTWGTTTPVVLGGIALLTSSQFWLAGNLDISFGSLSTFFHGPFRSDAVNQTPSVAKRKYLSESLSWKTSQFAFTTNCISFFSIGESTGSPSTNRRIAELLLKKICGGSFLTATAFAVTFERSTSAMSRSRDRGSPPLGTSDLNDCSIADLT